MPKGVAAIEPEQDRQQQEPEQEHVALEPKWIQEYARV